MILWSSENQIDKWNTFSRKILFCNKIILFCCNLAKILIGPPNAYPMDFPRVMFLLINNETFDESATVVTNPVQGNLYMNSFTLFEMPQLIFTLDTLIKTLEIICWNLSLNGRNCQTASTAGKLETLRFRIDSPVGKINWFSRETIVINVDKIGFVKTSQN